MKLLKWIFLFNDMAELFSDTEIGEYDIEYFFWADFSGHETDFPDCFPELLSADDQVSWSLGFELKVGIQVLQRPLLKKRKLT